MARLVHVNGPPGVGKSILARSYASEHSKILALDPDLVVSMIGGWRDDFWETLPVARRLAAAMAREHLTKGYDVLLPQLVTSDAEIAPYLSAADDSSATCVEVVLLADLPTVLERFSTRASGGTGTTAQYLQQIIDENGGPELLAKIYGDLQNYLEGRNADIVIDTTRLTPAEAYDRLRAALDA